MNRIGNPKDFWAGILYVGFGTMAIFWAQDYPFGSATRMGPGYFPVILGGVLTLIGAIALIRSFTTSGEPIASISWRPLLAITGGTILFAALLPRLGLIVALAALILTAASVSQNFRIHWKPLAALAALIAFCVVVFIRLLGVPMPLLGSWMGG